MKFTIITLFPEMFAGPFRESIIGRAIKQGKISVNFLNLRDFTRNKHRSVDDTPYGGGAGMILKVDICVRALEAAGFGYKILLSPHGTRLTQEKVSSLSQKDHLILLCGHYEGIDSRVDHEVDEIISIGDYILTGGEIPAIVIVDAVARYTPGVLGNPETTREESFERFLNGTKILEYPQYTRPRVFRGKNVPAVLLSGDHKKIKEWRQKEARWRTEKRH